jgi:hypothetical protein
MHVEFLYGNLWENVHLESREREGKKNINMYLRETCEDQSYIELTQNRAERWISVCRC